MYIYIYLFNLHIYKQEMDDGMKDTRVLLGKEIPKKNKSERL